MYRISSCFSIVLVLVAACASETQAAITQAPDIPQSEVCQLTSSGSYQLNVGRFLAWAFDEHGVPRFCADQDKDGYETFGERLQLVMNPITSEPKCETAAGILDLVADIVDEPGRSFHVSHIGGQSGPAAPEDLLARPPRVVVTCLNVKPATPTVTAANNAQPFRLSKVKIGGWKLKLRGDQKSLTADAGGTAWKTATAAQLSFAGDEIEGSNKVTAKAALGLDSGDVHIGKTADFRLIPYVKFDSQFVEAPGQENSIDKLAFGLLGEVLHLGDPLASSITIDPQYLTDSDQESEIVAGTLRYEPTLTVRSNPVITIPGGEMPLLPFLNFDYTVDGLLRFGRVIDPGNKPELLETGNFLYYGPVLKLFLLGTGFLEPLKVNIGYYHLWQGEGQFKRIENFFAGVAYTLDKDGHMEFKVSYDNGRDFENFAEREKWLAALGYKF
jgi:hypothetical protein